MSQNTAPDKLWMDMLTLPAGENTFFAIDGSISAFFDAERAKPLFGISGFSVKRRIPVGDNGYFMASREILFYTDLNTGEILHLWQNPFSGETVEVSPAKNDPVNRRYEYREVGIFDVSMDGSRDIATVAPPIEMPDRWLYKCDIFPFYPLGTGKMYAAAELFNFHVLKQIAYEPAALNVVVDWSRVGPWLPWMKMDKVGHLIYHCYSRRVQYAEIGANVRKLVESQYPLFLNAPESVNVQQGSSTSWTAK